MHRLKFERDLDFMGVPYGSVQWMTKVIDLHQKKATLKE